MAASCVVSSIAIYQLIEDGLTNKIMLSSVAYGLVLLNNTVEITRDKSSLSLICTGCNEWIVTFANCAMTT